MAEVAAPLMALVAPEVALLTAFVTDVATVVAALDTDSFRPVIEDFRFHDLRHTWASWLIQSGVPLSVLQEMGGWESIEMVRRYAHLAPNHLTEHAKQIDSIFGVDVPNMSHAGNEEEVKEA